METSLKRLWKRFTNWLNELSAPSEVQEPGEPEPVEVLLTEGEKNTVQHLEGAYLGTWVSCASCGLVHELEAVCHVCGSPLCGDAENCRLIRVDPVMDIEAVYCPGHAYLGGTR